MISGATFSPCRTYRYSLWRIWCHEPNPRVVVFVGLNPSVADEVRNDPTIRRCVGFAIDWGYDGYKMLNIFGLRSTDPRGLALVGDPVGPENDIHIVDTCARSALVVAAWGTHPLGRERGLEVRSMLKNHGVNLHVLGLTKNGSPKHPLYLPKKLKPIPWE